MTFFSPLTQTLLDRVFWLPQEGAVAGPTGRPPNSYAVVGDAGMLLVDAPYSWAMGAVRGLAERHEPLALVVSHADVMGQGDAFADYAAMGVPVLLHPADGDDPRSRRAAEGAGVELEDPMEHPALAAVGLEAFHVPGHTPGSVVLWGERGGGLALAGDSAVGPGPRQDPEPPRLLRPPGPARIAAFWQRLLAERPVRSVLPLHGLPYVDRDDMAEVARTLWEGEPMDPTDASADAR